MILSFINILIGLALSNFTMLLGRDKISGHSPTKFSFVFWLKDNWIKNLHSLIIASVINLGVQLNLSEIKMLTGFDYYGVYAIIIGFCPDLILSVLKDRLRWFTQKIVKVKGKEYERK